MTLQAYRFALDPTPAQARALASHCGAARKAFNVGLAHVKACLDQREAERSYGVLEDHLTQVPWTLPAQTWLRTLQRQAARRRGPDRRTGQRPSNRWRRTQTRIGRAHARAANLRTDVLHKATTTRVQRHQVIVAEDLNVAGMTRRKPDAGRGGRGLNRAIADAALAELRRQLAYKTNWYGSRLVVADRWYPSSKTCSACGAVKTKLALAERTWTCHGCGAAHDRDLNAAINLARLGEQATRVTGARPGPQASPKPGTAGSGPVAGRGADRKTSPPPGAAAGGDETSTPHDGQPAAGQTGTAPPQGEAA